jgi:hypothetical protein
MKENTMNYRLLMRMAFILAALFLALGQRSVLADDIVSVTVGTSGLGSFGSSEVFFTLTGIGGNTATLSNISLNGGTAGTLDAGNTVGSGANAGNGLGSGISLDDGTDFLNVFAQSFVASNQLSFLLDLTTNVVSPTPDQFSLFMLDPNGNPVATYDPTGFDNLLSINLDSTKPTPNIYSTIVSTATPTPTPEPSSLLMLGCGLLSLILMSRRRISFR